MSKTTLPEGTSVDVLRRAIAAQVCPWCGGGPYKKLANHTAQTHEIGARDLRDMADLRSRDSICSTEASERARDVVTTARPDMEESRARGIEAWKRMVEEDSRSFLQRYHDLGGDWMAVMALASERGVSQKQVVARLEKVGVEVPDGRSVSPRRGKGGGRVYPGAGRMCGVTECASPHWAKDMCKKHYYRRYWGERKASP